MTPIAKDVVEGKYSKPHSVQSLILALMPFYFHKIQYTRKKRNESNYSHINWLFFILKRISLWREKKPPFQATLHFSYLENPNLDFAIIAVRQCRAVFSQHPNPMGYLSENPVRKKEKKRGDGQKSRKVEEQKKRSPEKPRKTLRAALSMTKSSIIMQISSILFPSCYKSNLTYPALVTVSPTFPLSHSPRVCTEYTEYISPTQNFKYFLNPLTTKTYIYTRGWATPSIAFFPKKKKKKKNLKHVNSTPTCAFLTARV